MTAKADQQSVFRLARFSEDRWRTHALLKRYAFPLRLWKPWSNSKPNINMWKQQARVPYNDVLNKLRNSELSSRKQEEHQVQFELTLKVNTVHMLMIWNYGTMLFKSQNNSPSNFTSTRTFYLNYLNTAMSRKVPQICSILKCLKEPIFIDGLHKNKHCRPYPQDAKDCNNKLTITKSTPSSTFRALNS